MTSIKRVAVLFILLPLLGSVVSCLFFSARMRGTFTKWEMLGSPPTRPVKLLRMNYIQTVTGDIYESQHVYAEPCTSNCWVKVDTIPPIPDTMGLLPLEDCKNSFDIPSVDRFSDSVIECWRWGTGIRLDLQAINRDGNVQMWQKGQDDFGDGIMILMSPVIGALLGFVSTILVFAGMLFVDSIQSLMSRR